MISALLALSILPPNGLTEPVTVALAPKRHRDWKIELPAESFVPVGNSIQLAGSGLKFAVSMQGTNLSIDLDGDGISDTVIEGDEGSALLRNNNGFRYAIRLLRNENGWSYASSSTMNADWNGARISVIDQDNDGVFGEVGEDAILIGRGRVATWLGQSIVINGELVQIDVAKDGSQLTVSPFQGVTGRLRLADSFQGDGKVLSAVIRSADGKNCFDLAGQTGAVEIPTGRYRFYSGKVGLGQMAVHVSSGKSQTIDVAKGSEASLSWGGGVNAEFGFQRQGDQVAFSPQDIRYFGSQGEEYSNWFPVGKSPVFIIKEADTKQEIARAMFPGSC
ncbi:MAG: VCBS repeat-containing protein [Planctomycetes bacterium]|nr:VCBS repeat-containing protein [Planctomycetota bacterium]